MVESLILICVSVFFSCDENFYSLPSSVLSPVRLFSNPWAVACRAPLTVEYFRQEYWSGLPFPPPGDLPKLGTEHESPASLALVGRYFSTVPPGKPHSLLANCKDAMQY